MQALLSSAVSGAAAPLRPPRYCSGGVVTTCPRCGGLCSVDREERASTYCFLCGWRPTREPTAEERASVEARSGGRRPNEPQHYGARA